jgi:hypothetical protein
MEYGLLRISSNYDYLLIGMEAARMQEDRRRHRRFPLKLSIFCQKVGLSGGKLVSGKTVNVGPGGMLVQVDSGEVAEGDLLSVEMAVPPMEGLLDFGGSLSNHARVIRASDQQEQEADNVKEIALEFCDSPKLRI